MPYDHAQLMLDIRGAEILRDSAGKYCGLIYDDATGKLLKPGMVCHGHPTVGFGLALDVDPLTEVEAVGLLQTRVDAHAAKTLADMPWIATLSDARQRALIEMAYNLGDAGLSDFATFLSLMRTGRFEEAATDLAGTKWAKQVGNRATRIVGQIRNG